MKSPRWSVLMGGCLIISAAVVLPVLAKEPAAPPTQTPSGSSSSKDAAKRQKYSHANDFLIIGTVFNEKGYAFPGVELRIRRSGEKKFRWDSHTNSRGDFAVRVPQGTDYEMVVHAKGFGDQTRTMDAKAGLSEARLVFRMEPAKDGK